MSVTDEVILRVRQMILDGQLSPGDRLPPEPDFADQLSVSRSTLREAIKALELIRVLEVKRGDGTFVSSLSPALLFEAVQLVVELHQGDSIFELFQARRSLESAAAAMATPRITDTLLGELRASIAELGNDPAVDTLIAHDIAFHHAITAACGNQYLTVLLDSLSTQTVRARLWRGITEERVTDRAIAEHTAIVDALEGRDPNLVKAVVAAHIAGVEQWLHRSAGDT